VNKNGQKTFPSISTASPKKTIASTERRKVQLQVQVVLEFLFYRKTIWEWY